MRNFRKVALSTIITLVAFFSLLAGCSWLRPNIRPAPPITFQSLESECSIPTEAHFVQPTEINPAPYRVVYFESCLGRDNLVLVLWPGEMSEINLQFAHLLALHFKESLSFKNRVGYSYESFGPYSNAEETVWMIVYTLNN